MRWNARARAALVAITVVVAGCDGGNGDTDAGGVDAGGEVDGGTGPCAGRVTCATAGTSCSGDDLVTCAADADGCLVETTTSCSDGGQVCDDSGTTAMCAAPDPCADIPAAERCDTAGRACDGDSLEVCEANADGCLVLTVTDCAAVDGGACDDSGATPMCVMPADPCAGVADACTTAGTSCTGDTLVTCAPDAFGCLVETETDCTARAGGTCDGSASPPACTFTGDPCAGVTECATAGTTCDGPDLVVCEPDGFGCLVETRTDCTAATFGFCDASATPAPTCETAATDPCMGMATCTPEGRSCSGDTLAVCAPNAFGCLVETTTDCTASSQVCGTADSIAMCGDVCDFRATCPSATYCDGADVVTCSADSDGCLVEESRSTCTSGCSAGVCTGTNDTCATALAVTADVTFTGEDTADGGARPGDTSCDTGGTATGDTLWYALTVPAGQVVEIDVSYGTASDLLIFRQADCSATVCDDLRDRVPPGEERFTVSNASGTSTLDVVVGVGPWNTADGGTYDISFTYLTAPAANAVCSGATTVTTDTTITDENTHLGGVAPADASCTAGGSATGGALFYSVTIPPGQRVDVALENHSAVDLSLFEQGACSDTTCNLTADVERFFTEVMVVENASTAAVTRVIGVRPKSTAEGGSFDIHFSFFPIGTGESCASPYGIGASGTIRASTDVFGDDYSLDASGCTGDSTPGSDVAYEIALAAGQTLDATLFPQAWDGALYVLTDCASLTSCVDGSDTIGDGDAETVSYTATSATTVYLIVDSWSSTVSGPYRLEVTLSP